MIEKLGISKIKEIRGNNLKPSESHLFSCVKHEELKKIDKTYREMLVDLIEEWKFIESYLASNASRNDGFWYNEFLNRQNKIKITVEKATNKSWEEIKELIK